MKKSFYIETFGCQMNKGDSELMGLSMIRNGFIPAPDMKSAEICIFNTCSVRQNAEDRAIAIIKETKKSRAKKNSLIILTGCMAQHIGDDMVTSGIADISIGPYQSPACGEIITEFLSNDKKKIYSSQKPDDFAPRIDNDLIPDQDTHSWHKWVTITHGCENFCSYCIVPYVRGKLISFPSEKIIKFIDNLAKKGITEITLLGQNVNQYGQDSGDIPFYRLLEKTAMISGLKRINFLTSHPMDFSPEIVDVIKNHPNISRGIHLPLQSGSDKILKEMNRKYTISHYYNIVDIITKELGEFALSTDLITGFPDETDKDFKETLKAVKNIKFDEAFMFAYSPRTGTPAAEIAEPLSREEKLERLKQLITLQRKISLEKLRLRIDKKETVIASKTSKKSNEELLGKTGLNHPVVFKGNVDDIGKEILVEIRGIKGSTLIGEKII
ncbi:MAG: tRNA (N6-isopentenyl adenosine(37)-C2)-methylthiotransferase MiaB [Spirochaetota bacterium]